MNSLTPTERIAKLLDLIHQLTSLIKNTEALARKEIERARESGGFTGALDMIEIIIDPTVQFPQWHEMVLETELLRKDYSEKRIKDNARVARYRRRKRDEEERKGEKDEMRRMREGD